MLKFVPVDVQNIKHLELLKTISNSTQFLGDVTKYKFHHNPNNIYGNDFIVLDDSEIIGYLGLTDKVETSMGNTTSIYLALDPRFYGNGYAKRIVDVVKLELSKSRDIDYIVADVNVLNSNGKKSIIKCGFTEIGGDDEENQYISEKLR